MTTFIRGFLLQRVKRQKAGPKRVNLRVRAEDEIRRAMLWSRKQALPALFWFLGCRDGSPKRSVWGERWLGSERTLGNDVADEKGDDDDDDVYYNICWRLKLEGETENMGVCRRSGRA